MLLDDKGASAQAFLDTLIAADPTKGDYFKYVATSSEEAYDEALLKARLRLQTVVDRLKADNVDPAAAGEILLIAGIISVSNHPLPDGTPAPCMDTSSATDMQKYFLRVLNGVLPTILAKAFETFNRVVTTRTALPWEN